MSGRRVAVEAILVLAFFALVSCAVVWPIPAELGSAVIGPFPSDAAYTLWRFDALQDTGYHLFGTTTFDRIAVPYGYEQPNSLNLQTLIPYYPTFLATKVVGEIAALNLCILVGLTLSGSAMYFLARRVGAVPAVAVWAGLAWLLFPWHVVRAQGHAAYVHTACFPLLLAAMHAYWQRADARRLALVFLGVTACWLTAGIFGVMGLAVVLACALVTALLTRPVRRGLSSGALLAASAVAASAFVYLLAIPGGGDAGVGATRQASSLRPFGLRVTELVIPAPGSGWLSNVFEDYHRRVNNNFTFEVNNFLGWATIGLALVGLVFLWRARCRTERAERILGTGLLASAIVALALALPSPTWLFGYRWDRTPALLLFDVLPAFRVPSRWSVVIMLAAVVLGTLGLQAVWERLRTRGQVVAYVAVALVTAFTVWELGLRVGKIHFHDRPVPAEYALLERTPPGTLAEYPLWRGDTTWTGGYMFWQRKHGRRLLNGADADSPNDAVRRVVGDPAAPGVAAQLAALGVTAITTRGNSARGMAALRRSGFSLVGTAPDDVAVWRVVAPAAPAVVTLSPEFQEPDPWKDRSVLRMFGSTGYIELRASHPTRGTLALTIVARGAPSRRVRIASRRFEVNARGTTVEIPYSVPRGVSRIPIQLDGIPDDEVAIATTVPTLLPAQDEPGRRRS